MKHLLTFLRYGVSGTLASTVGSPSVDRRGTMLKHYAFMLLFLLGSLNVWGAWEKASSIAAGDVVVFVNESSSKELTGISTTSTKYGIASDYTTTPAGTFAFTVEAGSSEGTLSFKNGDVYLNWSSGNSLTTAGSKSTNSSWTVSFDDGNASIANANTSTRKLVYNSGSPRFACYTSAQQPIQIYKQTGSSEPTVSLDHIAITGTPTKTSYEQGEAFDPTGLTVTAYYDDETDAAVTDDVEWSFDPATFTVAGENKSVTATATYQEKEASETYNDITVTEHVVTAGTYDITFNNAFFGTTGLTGALSGTNLKDYSGSKSDITVEYKKGTGSNMYLKDSEIRLYSGNTLVITAPSGYNITSVAGLKSTMTANEGTITDTEWSGESNSVIFSHNDTKGNSSLATIYVTYAAVDMSKPATPEFSVAAGIYTEAQSVELSCTTGDATIYYTTNGSTPDNTSTEYTGSAISLSERGTYTIKAIAIKGEDASAVASATYTINLPYIFASVSELFTYLDENSLTTLNDVTVTGYVSEIVTEYSTQYSNISFNISDDGSTTAPQLQSFRGKGTDASSIEVGDKVTISGNYKVYNSTKELDQNNTITNRIAKGAVTSVVVSGAATKTTYSANETFETAGLVVTATYANGFSEVVTEGITWGDDLTDHKVAESTTVQVTATVGGVTSAAYGVAVTVASKTLVSIAVGTSAYTIYTGEALPHPVVTATFSEGEPEDVSAFAVYDTEDVFNTATIDNPDPQTITVSYTFGGATETVTYTVSVKDYANANDAPYTVTEALHIITAAIGNTESAREIVVTGTVSVEKVSNYKNRYKISDGANELLVYNGKGFNSEDFTDSNYPKVNDVVKVKGKVINYNNNTPEFASGKSYLLSQVRPATIAIENVASFEVGATDLTESDLDITTPSDGDITFSSGDDAVATIVANAIHAVAPGTATITANLAATANENALNYAAASTTFNVTVIAAQVKYAITFDGNGADGGSAPEAIADKAAGTNVPLPANTYTKTGYTFNGWKVYDENEDEVTVTAGAFEMPASPVTIKAQWAELSVWASVYTSNVTLTTTGGTSASVAKVVYNEEQYDAIKAGTGSVQGAIKVTVPAQTSTLHFHAYGWNSENVGLTVTAPAGVTVTPATEISINSNSGIASNTPFTLSAGADPKTDAYYAVALSGNDEEVTLTISATSDKRFVLFGVNQEGGVLPVLDHIVVTGTATALAYEVGDVFDPAGLGANAIYTLGDVEQEPVAIDAEDIVWSFEPATIAANTAAVTVTATYEGKSASKEVTGLTVTVPEPEIIVSAASLAFGNKAKGAAVDDKELTVTLKSVENATLTISGEGAAAFSVTPAALTASGTVAVSASTDNVGTFNATLTISDDANEAAPQEVALSITVEASDDISGTWNLVTDAADLMAGMQVIVASVADGEGNLYTLGGPRGNNGDNRLAVAGTASGNVLTPAAGTKVLTLVDAGDGKYALQLVSGNYLYAASSSSNYLKEKETLDANGTWSISISEGKANIVAQGTNTRNTIRHNNGNNSNLFSCYASGQQDVVLYAKPFDYTREIAQGVLSTTCLPNGGQIFGASVFEIAYMDYEADGTTPHKIYFDEVEGGIMEAGMPYVVLANEGSSKFGVYYTDNENKDAQSKNGLVGYIGTGRSLLENEYFIYDNKFFYVSAADAASGRIHISNNRAFINLSQVPGYNNEPVSVPAPGRRRVSLGNGASAPQVATGMENVQGGNVQSTKVLINGQLFILRGEKMYDATGRLVK